MKNIKVFSLFVSIFYLFFAFPARSDEIFVSPEKSFPYTFSIGASSGILYGQAEEIVYKYSNRDTYWSQLLWDMQPLVYVGTSLNLSQTKPLEKIGFFADFSLKFGIPGNRTGNMEDRDWMGKTDDILTHFSSHDNYTQGALLADYANGISMPLASRVILKLYVNFSYMYFLWDSRNGYTQYGKEIVSGVYEPWDESIEKNYHYGRAIGYAQEWIMVSLGIGVTIPFTVFAKPFSAELGIQGSGGPFIHCKDVDDHFGRNIRFEDYTSGGVFLEPKGKLIFSPHPMVDISLHIGWRYMSGLRGRTDMRSPVDATDVTSFNDGAGVGYNMLDAGLSVQVRF
jgi:outer membrane protease